MQTIMAISAILLKNMTEQTKFKAHNHLFPLYN